MLSIHSPVSKGPKQNWKKFDEKWGTPFTSCAQLFHLNVRWQKPTMLHLFSATNARKKKEEKNIFVPKKQIYTFADKRRR